jgi:hypothetical protein
MDLTHTVYVVLVAVAMLVVAYWVLYTTHLKAPRNVGKNEGIAMATQAKERSGKTGTL